MKILPPAFSCAALVAHAFTHAGVVLNNSDIGPGSLRDVLDAAVDAETISFSPTLDGNTITLTTGSLTIDGMELIIDASSLSSGISISGNGTTRILNIKGNANVTLKNLHWINGREAAGSAGGIAVYQSHLVLDGCTIRNCISKYDGGGLWGNAMTGSMTRCKIDGNQSGSFGGGIFLIGVSSLNLTSSQISGNKSLAGGGIFNLAASPTFSNCTIQGNAGSGMRSDTNSNPSLHNSVVWGNSADGGTTASKQLMNLNNSRPAVAHCLIEGASGSSSFNDGNLVNWNTGNLNGSLPANNPDFVSPVNPANAPSPSADLRVFTSSPLFNCGDNAFAVSTLDLIGKQRIQDLTVDMGAFEGGYVSFPFLHPSFDPSGDENENGLSNYLEYAMGSDPSGSGDPSSLPAVSSSADSLFLTSTMRSNGIDVLPRWFTSASLLPASWEPMIKNLHYETYSSMALTRDRQRIILKLFVTDPRRFYRQGFESND